MRPLRSLIVFLSILSIGALGAAAGDDAINLLVNKGPGIDDITMSWTPGHGGPYTVYISNVPPPEALPGNAVATTPGLTRIQNTPIAPGGVLFIRVLGAGCLAGSECPSGFCSDGFCCNTACDGTCQACDLAGFQGTCTSIPTGQDPEDDCAPGQACDGAGACAPCPAETCNGQDDDCDGTADDGNPGGGAACSTGMPGVCAAGVTQCQSGSITCNQSVPSSPEVCDSLDNDCDGASDEGDPGGGAACSTGLPGVCAAGTLHCVAGNLSCVQNVSPSADLPDESFLDTNCDGIDGDLTKAIFVSTAGTDANPGTTPAFPVRTITQGVLLASAGARNQVLVMTGVYATESQIVLKDGVGIYGNYTNPAFTARTLTLTATQFAATNPTAATGVNLASSTDIQLLFVQSANASGLGQSSYGIVATNSPGLRVRYSRIQAGSGGPAMPGGGTANGPGGGNGGLGGSGCENSGSPFCDSCALPQGGPAGTSACGATGGTGGSAGNAGSPSASGTAGGPATPGGNGNWNTPSLYWGQNGGSGIPGVNGPAGIPLYVAGGYTPQNGSAGTTGGNGRGGGGGGGGGAGTVGCDSYGGGGGGGGAGGCGSSGAAGGTSAGGSFAIYLWASNALIQNSELRTSSGGTGGSGGPSGLPGPGGLGGRNAGLPGAGNNYGGPSDQEDGSNGGRGGDGGGGGQGGHGGGGAGGPSIGIVIGGGSTPSTPGNTFIIGVGGSGGTSSGNPGPAGGSANTFAP